MTNAKQSIEIIEGLTVELTAEQLEEVSRKLQSAKDKAKKVPTVAVRRATVEDIVVITSSESGSVNKVGDIGKIITDAHDSQPYRVEVPGRLGGGNWEYERCVRLATAEEIAKYEESFALEPKLKVSDWVRIKDYADWSDISAKPYKIVEIDEDGDGVFYDDANDRRNTHNKDFEIISKLTPFDRAGREPGEFKKGDIVRVVDAMGGNNMVGDLAEVYLTDGTDTPKVVDRDGDAVWEKAELVTPVESRVDIAEGGERA